MNCEILTVGSELTQGHSLDTNSSFIAEKLLDIGIVTERIISIPDDESRIAAQIKESMKNVPVVVVTGGLGSTEDDITRKSIANALDRQLVFDSEIAVSIKERFEKRQREMPRVMKRQAYLVEGATPIISGYGTAPGMIIEEGKKVVFILPGVPKEMKDMLENGVLPYLKEQFKQEERIVNSVIKVSCVKEAELVQDVEEVAEKFHGKVSFAYLPYLGEVHIRLSARNKDEKKAEADVASARSQVAKKLGENVFGFDDDTLESVVGELLKQKKMRIAIAESCTGGLIADRITNVSGSSDYFDIGVITYSDLAKQEILKVDEKIIEEHGAVSEACAVAMATGVEDLADADVGLAVTGIAGPTGATPEKPVGLVYIAIAMDKKSICRRFYFGGRRKDIKFLSSQHALDMVRRLLTEDSGEGV